MLLTTSRSGIAEVAPQLFFGQAKRRHLVARQGHQELDSTHAGKLRRASGGELPELEELDRGEEWKLLGEAFGVGFETFQGLFRDIEPDAAHSVEV